VISIAVAPPCHGKRDHRDKPGDDDVGRPGNLKNAGACCDARSFSPNSPGVRGERWSALHDRANKPASVSQRLHPRHAGMEHDIPATQALRLGLREISGLAQAHALMIESVRGEGFDSVRDLWLRTRLTPSVLERLAKADAFGSLGLSRRDALWAVR